MDIRAIKLALSVDLINLPGSEAPIQWAQKRMNRFEHDTGPFLWQTEHHDSRINERIHSKTVELRYQFCKLDLNVVQYDSSPVEIIKGFDLLAV